MVDHAVGTYRMVTLPAMENLERVCSASLFVDRQLGRAVSSVTDDTPGLRPCPPRGVTRPRGRVLEDGRAQLGAGGCAGTV